MGAKVLNSQGEEVPIVMGSYGIGIERILAAAIEAGYDKDGIVWPLSIAPFQCVLSILSSKDHLLVEQADKVYKQLQALGIEVLLDDRDERAGVKFKDADLIGIPYRINFGSKKFAQGKVEWVERSTKKIVDVDLSDLVRKVQSINN